VEAAIDEIDVFSDANVLDTVDQLVLGDDEGN